MEVKPFKIDPKETYLVGGKHKVLGIFHDVTQRNTMHEYVLVYQNFDTDTVIVNRMDAYGRVFGQGLILVPVKPYKEDYNEYSFS